jgi:hypothetical protein
VLIEILDFRFWILDLDNERVATWFFKSKIQNPKSEIGSLPDGVTDRIGPSEGPGPGSSPGRETQ